MNEYLMMKNLTCTLYTYILHIFSLCFWKAFFLGQLDIDGVSVSILNKSTSDVFRYGFFLCYFVDEQNYDENWSQALQCEIVTRLPIL